MTKNPSAPALDPAVLETLRQLNEPGQPDVVREVLGLFRTDAPSRLEAISTAMEAQDAAALQRAAHTLKGAAAAIGATALHGACRALEEAGKQGALDSVAADVATLRHEYERVRDAIDQLL